ncbi:MAG: histidine phosphatase family protein [Myxococcales bacterium]|nr:histidine phosphatase family protein [Myxococcales bacterium]
MRHSIAVPADFQTTDDSRCLAARGRLLAAEAGLALAEHLKKSGLQLEYIVTSPLVRTVQTAELVALPLQYDDEIRAMHSLRSEAPSQRGLDELLALGHGVVLAVTHEPIVSAMSGRICGEQEGGFGAGFRPAEIRGFRDNASFWRHQP